VSSAPKKSDTQTSSPAAPSGALNVDLGHSPHAFRGAGKGLKKDFEQLNRWFEIALNNMGRGLSMFDAKQHLIVCNKRYREIFSLPESLTQPGTPFAEIVRYHVKMETGRDDPEEIKNQRKWINNHVAEMARGKSFSSTRQLKDGRTILVSNQPLPDGGWVDLQEDITEKCEAENKISWMARHDALTELANRHDFHEQLQRTCRLGREGGAGFALHWIDLDRFKEVNDTLGHPAGDALLKSVAKRLREVLREPDIVARLGGDEFAIIQRGVTSETQAGHLASRIIKTISQPHHTLGHTVSVGASVGIALAPRDGLDADEIVKKADLALYKAKESGRGTYRVFEASQAHEVDPRRSLDADLRVALSRGELELYYQPIVDVKTQETTSFEALMRWRHPEYGIIAPDDFIPIAEEMGLIIEIGAWALNEACQQAAGWSKDVKVTVNLSPLQFDGGDLDQVVTAALAGSGLSAQRLELEITEGLLLRDDFATHELLHKLRALGVSIALDDFGTAYASLSYLRSFPFDKIKIDRSFIRDLDHPEQRECVAIINAVTGLARQLKMTTVAEGVETLDHVNTALVAGCDEVQGFYFSEPVRADKVEALLAQGPQHSSAA
jgi:diguanylate cyclase (GGDEF)-like protein